MEHVPFGGWTVDRCANCRGLWFDAREQEQLKDVEGSEAIDVGKPAGSTVPPTTGKVKCPVCNTQMIQMVDHRQPHLKFESCTVCYGAFFDAGEFRDYKEVTLVETVRGLFGRGK
jgi:Zn-finger nucleic acid-binding protein